MHAVRHAADVQPAPGEVGLGLVEEAVGVADMPGDAAKLLQLFERQPPRPVEHVLFVEELSAAAILGSDSSCSPTQRRSAAELTDMPQLRPIQVAGPMLPLMRWSPDF